jgi:geranylgeranyl reductase family protein
MAKYDALVVGAGPAGSTAARELAAAGARVLMLDRADFPRYKACGGGVPVRTERALPFPIDSVIEDSVSLLDVRYQGRQRFVRDSGAPFAHMVMRDRFDALLADRAAAAGAEFRPNARVRALHVGRSVTVAGDGFAEDASFVVSADGAHSPVGRMAGLGDGLAECAAWEVEIRAKPPVRSAFGSTAMIDLGYRPWGYVWLFPKERVLSVGIVLPRNQAGAMKDEVRRFAARLGLGDAAIEIARGHKIRFRRGREPIARERVLLAGDAAGLADEFTQEGIFYAIHSGRLAARNVLRALGGDGDLHRYQDDVDREIMPELRAARLLGFMFYGMLRRAPRPWMFASAHTGYLWNAFFAVQRGESTYEREVGRVPLLPGIAARMLGMQ